MATPQVGDEWTADAGTTIVTVRAVTPSQVAYEDATATIIVTDMTSFLSSFDPPLPSWTAPPPIVVVAWSPVAANGDLRVFDGTLNQPTTILNAQRLGCPAVVQVTVTVIADAATIIPV